MLSTNRLYKWEVEGDIGTITEDGIFTLADTVNKDGKNKGDGRGFNERNTGAYFGLSEYT